jgi:hypothetical protein
LKYFLYTVQTADSAVRIAVYYYYYSVTTQSLLRGKALIIEIRKRKARNRTAWEETVVAGAGQVVEGTKKDKIRAKRKIPTNLTVKERARGMGKGLQLTITLLNLGVEVA